MFQEKDDGFIKSIEDLPIFKKGKEIFYVINRICQLVPEDDEQLQYIKSTILIDASMLSVKVANAESAGFYDMKMEAATLIRKAAHDIMVQYNTFVLFDFKDAGYFSIIKELLEEYRILFIEWISKFDKSKYTVDYWGLFNPPGFDPLDFDPENDIPFDDFNN